MYERLNPGDMVLIRDDAEHIPENVKRNLYVVNAVEREEEKGVITEQNVSLREIDCLPIFIDDALYTSIFLDSKYVYKRGS